MPRIVVETRTADTALPEKGEVWLCVATGELYELRDRGVDRRTGACGAWRSAHKIGAGETSAEYGGAARGHCAVWDSAVSEGQWIRVVNCPKLRAVGDATFDVEPFV